MSPELNIKLLEIANDLPKVHTHDYTANRVIGTYWEIYVLFSQTELGLANRDSSITNDVDFPSLSNKVQE